MKKILSLLLVIASVFAISTSLVACNGPKPKLNFDKAEDNLKDNDYFVEVIDDEDDIIDAYGAYGYMIEKILVAYSEDREDRITIIKFKTSKAAKLVWESDGTSGEKMYKYLLRKFGDDMEKDEVKALEERIEGYEDNAQGRSGKYVWYGTKDAVEATKG